MWEMDLHIFTNPPFSYFLKIPRWVVGSLQKGGETNWCAARGVAGENQFVNLDEIRIDNSLSPNSTYGFLFVVNIQRK